jgi:hypothetical protein
MKPWRPYWKALERLMDELLRTAEPPPFSHTDKIGEWIENLKFTELSLCDDECRQLSDDLPDGPIEEYHSVFSGTDIHWQMILRCECALDFCRGRVEKRGEFDWSQESKVIYRWLLVEFWRRSAPYWASKLFGSNRRRTAWHRARFTRELCYRFRGIDPTKN